jgi:hypothetical protein
MVFENSVSDGNITVLPTYRQQASLGGRRTINEDISDLRMPTGVPILEVDSAIMRRELRVLLEELE